MIADDDYEMAIERAEKAEAERDALRDEVTRWKYFCDEIGRVRDELVVENHALRRVVAAADAMARRLHNYDAGWVKQRDYRVAKDALAALKGKE